MKDYSKYFKGPSLKDARSRGRTEVQHLDDAFEIPADMVGIGKGQTYYIQTYGCQANERDTETLSGILEMMGYAHTDEVKQADVVLLNTCAIRENAEEKVFGKIGYLKNIKKTRPNLIFGVCGCMAQEEVVVNKILEKFPQVDLIFGTHNIHRLPVLLKQAMLEKELVLEVWSKEGDVIENLPSHRANNYKAWVNIMYGCNKFCTYCIVPYVRGRETSRTIDDICREIEKLAREGYKEITLLGQNVNSYGLDFHDGTDFGSLIHAIDKIDGIKRVRYMTSHPKDMTFGMVDAMAASPKVVRHMHLPVQHGANEILRRMNRGYTIERFKELLKYVREKMPGITVTTDLITGFPGETEDMHEETLTLLKEMKFDSAYTFIYSPRRGTPAARMTNQVSDAVCHRRLQEIMNVENEISLSLNKEMEGKVYTVIAEGETKQNPDNWFGRTSGNKMVIFPKAGSLSVGDILKVRVDTAQTWILKGTIVE